MFTFKFAMKQASEWLALQKVTESPSRGKASTRAGVIDPLASQQHNDSGLPIGIVAQFQEFGTPTIPARSFVKAPFKKNEPRYRAMLRAALKIEEGLTSEQVLAPIGELMAADMKQAVKDMVPPPNAPSTIKRKESSTPLIETSVLVNSITSDVVKG